MLPLPTYHKFEPYRISHKSCLHFILSNMMQKIVIKVHMCDKCRSKAMKHAAVVEGVTSVAIGGAEKDRVVVIGHGIDSASLTCLLRKKVGYASLVSVEEVKGKKEENYPIPIQSSSNHLHHPQYPMCEVACNLNPTGCSIM